MTSYPFSPLAILRDWSLQFPGHAVVFGPNVLSGDSGSGNGLLCPAGDYKESSGAL